MKKLKSETQLLHRTFMLTIGAKGLFGLFETIGGLLTFLIKPEQIHAVASWLTADALANNPKNPIALYVLDLGSKVNSGTTTYFAIYLIIHGLIKVVLVWALFRDKNWAYPWMLVALGIFIVTQVGQLIAGFTPGVFLLTLFDLFVLWLTWREYRLHQASKQKTTDEPLSEVPGR